MDASTNDNATLPSLVISALRKAANVPVYVGQRESMNQPSILVSQIKMDELANMYETLHQFTFAAWRNLPSPPDCEKTFVLMWLIACDKYDVNHFSIKWEDATPNSFVHLWSITDRLRTTFEPINANWLLDSRGPVGYVEELNLGGPVDVHIFPRETIVPPHIGIFTKSMHEATNTNMHTDHTSSFDFKQSLKVTKPRVVLDVDAMARRNMRMALGEE